MNRRTFIEKSCLACGALVAGTSLLSLESCSTTKGLPVMQAQDGIISLPVSDFREERIKVIRTNTYKDNILVVRNADGSYSAVLMKCTHRGGNLRLEGSANLKCALHGSLFTYHGDVLMGPAKNPLLRFPATVENDLVIIRLG